MPIYTQSYTASYTPVVTLVGGAGNTVPVYSTNLGNYSVRGDICRIKIQLINDGGDEGAGSGVLTISLPIVATSRTGFNGATNSTYYGNGATIVTNPYYANITAGASTFTILAQSNTAGTLTTNYTQLTGVDQNSTSRYIFADFEYWIY